MSSRRAGGSGAGVSVRDKLFNPNVDVEQLVLDLIHSTANAAILVSTVGDATQANSVFTMQALNLDSFVFSLLTSDTTRNWDDYRKRHEEIVKDWPRNPTDAANRARNLFELTISVWAKQRLFKLRRYSYFGEGWKKGQELDTNTMEKEEEKEGIEQDEG